MTIRKVIGRIALYAACSGNATAQQHLRPHEVTGRIIGSCQRCDLAIFVETTASYPNWGDDPKERQRALSAAAKACCEPIVSLLLAKNADPCIKDEFGWSAFEKLLIGDCQTVFWNLVLGLDLPATGRDDLTMQRRKEAALLAAARWGSSTEVEALLAMGVEPEVEESQYSPLHHAIVAGDAMSVTLLLQAGAQPRHVPSFRRFETHATPSLRGSAIMLAVNTLNAEILDLVLNACAPLNSRELD